MNRIALFLEPTLTRVGTPVKAIVVDRQALLREGLASVLRQHQVEVQAQSAGGRGLLALLRKHRPQLILLDSSPTDLPLFDLLNQLANPGPMPNILLLMSEIYPVQMRLALQTGVRGFIHKFADPHEFLSAVHCVAGGGTYISPTLAEPLRSAPDLPPRRMQVLQALVTGGTLEDIARDLNVSRSTIKADLSKLQVALKAPDRSRLIATAVAQGLAQPAK